MRSLVAVARDKFAKGFDGDRQKVPLRYEVLELKTVHDKTDGD